MLVPGTVDRVLGLYYTKQDGGPGGWGRTDGPEHAAPVAPAATAEPGMPSPAPAGPVSTF